MARAPLVTGGLAALLAVVAGTYLLTRSSGRTPEGVALLTPVPGAASFAPRELPGAPVLETASPQGFSVDFGYKVGGTAYSYSLALVFAADAEDGKAVLTARHGGRTAMVETPAQRLWDAPRDAFSVAVKGRFDMAPAVPALCLKAVVGPSKARYDLSQASLCVAQRDGTGTCHPETLACGQIRSKS